MLDLRFLRTCRQIYHEIGSFLYKTNTVCFNNGENIEYFIENIPQACDIRSMGLSMPINTFDPWLNWRYYLGTLSYSMTSLQKIRVGIDSLLYGVTTQYGVTGRDVFKAESTVLMNVKGDEVRKGLAMLAILPFDKAVVTIRDDSLLDPPIPVHGAPLYEIN